VLWVAMQRSAPQSRTHCTQVTTMAGFVMFSHCKLLQAQSRCAAKAELEDQPSNGDAPGVVCMHSAPPCCMTTRLFRSSAMRVECNPAY
jgi:hypothetical protein